MSRPRLRSILIGSLILLLIIPAYFSFVSSSTGYIRINSTSSSTPGQQVQAGGDINLYFGQVTWSSNATFLFMSTNGQAEITSGDFVFTPKFSVHDLSNNTVTTYNSDSGNWVVGYNWINGTIASSIIGNYYIKAFDQISSEIAVTDTYITVYSTGYSATLNVSRSSGPGGVPIQFTGSNYPPEQTVTIAYLDPALGTWNYLANTTTDGAGQISVNSSVPDLKKSVGNGDFPQTVTQISYRSQIGSIVYGAVSYDEYSRGLTQVGSQYANGLFGNGTTFGSNIRFKSGDIIQIAGQWWHPNSLIYLRWDGYDVVGTVTSDQWLNANIIGTTAASTTNGTFLTNITIPDCAPGAHYLAVEDSQTRITVQIFVSSATLQISPLSGAGGVNTQFTGSGYPYSTSVNISYLDPYFGTWNYWTTTTSNSTGNIVINSQIPDLKRSQSTGDYGENYNIISFRAEVNGAPCAYASFNEYLRGLTQVGTSTANGLYGNGTDLSSNVNVNVGDSLLISGRYFHPGIVYIKLDGVNVVGTVTGSEWASTEATGSTTASDPTGSFSTTITIPSVNGGSHFIAIEDTQTIFITKVNVSAAVIPNPTPTPTPTPTPSSNPNPTPTPAPTPNPSLPTPTLDLSCKSTTQSTDFSVEIDGKLSLNGTPLTDIPIQISYNNGKWQSLTTVNTLSDGTFVVAWHPDVTGNYLIEASWAGNSSMNGVSKTVTLAITYDPDLQQNYFKLTSNSTITQFAFNSTSKELSFTVSGPPETTGYVNIYIPKTLIADISTLKTYIDGNEVTFNSESLGDSWLISFSYSHSTHLVTMDLGNAVQPYNGTSNPDWSTYGIPIAVVAVIAVIAGIATVFVKRRKGTK